MDLVIELGHFSTYMLLVTLMIRVIELGHFGVNHTVNAARFFLNIVIELGQFVFVFFVSCLGTWDKLNIGLTVKISI